MKNIKVENISSANSYNKIANQFVITCSNGDRYFQSYNSIIIKIGCLSAGEARKNFHIKDWKRAGVTYLDERYWNYSNTTGKYRNIFLGEDRKATEARIKSGEYKLVNLN